MSEFPQKLRNEARERIDIMLGRVPLYVVIGVLGFVQLYLLNEQLTASEADELTSILFGLGLYDWLGIFLLYWLVEPVVLFIVNLSWHYYRDGEQILSEEYWSETL